MQQEQQWQVLRELVPDFQIDPRQFNEVAVGAMKKKRIS